MESHWKWLVSESYSCVTVCLQGPKLHLFQACRFKEEKKSQEKTRGSYYSKLPANTVIGSLQVEIRQLLKFHWKTAGTCPQVSWVAGREMFPYEKTEEEILSSMCPERGPLDGLWNCWLVWQRQLMTWFQKACIQVLLPSSNDRMILQKSLNFPDYRFCYL